MSGALGPGGSGSKADLGAAIAALAVAGASLAWFYSLGVTNLYGDAIAHMEGARRLFDSLTPGYREIGTVWLPLYHIMVAPLARNDHLWRTGLAGSIVSAAAFAATGFVLFRLAREMNGSAAAGAVALAGFVLSPSMAYVATTPLTEPTAILCMVLLVYALFRFQQSGSRLALVGAAVAAFCGTLTRYDMWYVLPFAAVFVLLCRASPWRERVRSAALFSLLAGLGPVLWLVHNAVRFGNALEFYNGAKSAKALYAYQLATTGFRYPTDGSLMLSARYFLADMVLVIGAWPVELAVLGLALLAFERHDRARRAAAMLLLVPFAFYVHSMAYSAVPIYVPTLFPNTYYNLRYGLEMLPAVALFPSFLVGARLPARARTALLVLVFGVIVSQTGAMLARGPKELAIVRESELNTPCRSQSAQGVLAYMKAHYDGTVLIVAAGKWPCLLPAVGISFRNTVSESNAKYWRRLREGPDASVGWILRSEGDAVDDLMRAYPAAFKDFERVDQETFAGEPLAQVYRRRSP